MEGINSEQDIFENIERQQNLNDIPLIVKEPEVGLTKPQSIEIKVVFPAPFGPNKPKI